MTIERTKNAKIHDVLIKSEWPNVADIAASGSFIHQHIRKFKTLSTEFRPKLSKTVHVAGWYENFECMVKTHDTSTVIVWRNVVRATFANELKAEHLLVREVKKLEEDGGVNQKEP